MADPQRRGLDPFTGFLMLACAVLAVLVVLLALQNRELKTQIVAMAAAVPVAHGLEAGDSLGELTLRDAAGSEFSLEFGGGSQRTVLLVFSTQCPACQETLPIWSDLLAAGENFGARVLAVQLDEADDPAGVVLPVPIYHLNHELSPAMQEIPYIPATIVLDGGGTVEQIWFGVLQQEATESLATAIRPGA